MSGHLFESCTAKAGAEFDNGRVYRYLLWRQWSETGGRCLWIMLNPSTADETKLDQTIRKCVAFSKFWGFGGLEVVNLFALRATDPKVMLQHKEPIGASNDEAITRAAQRAGRILAAWGKHGEHRGRAAFVESMVRSLSREVYCLGVNGDNSPRHPLYVKQSTAPVVWRWKDLRWAQ